MKILPIENYQSYLQDESRQTGIASGIAFPENANELADALRHAESRGFAVTIQGARTGLKGDAVPHGGLIVNLERMNKILTLFEESGAVFMRVQAGATLGEIEKTAQSRGCFFPCDPTEKAATIGGIYASDAQGLSALGYGGVARWTSDVASVSGVVTELTLRLLPLPKQIWGVVFFFTDDDSLNAFVPELRKLCSGRGFAIVCAEYFNNAALRILDGEREKNGSLAGLSDFPADVKNALYIELHGDDESAMDAALTQALDAFAASGGLEENTWAGSGLSGIKRFRDMRHVLVEVLGAKVVFGEFYGRLE